VALISAPQNMVTSVLNVFDESILNMTKLTLSPGERMPSTFMLHGIACDPNDIKGAV